MPRKKKEVVEKEVGNTSEKKVVKKEVVKKEAKTGRSAWIDEVKKVQSRDGVSYKEAMSIASSERKSKE